MSFIPRISSRIQSTVTSSIKQAAHFRNPSGLNMGHGMVYWSPPEIALEKAKKEVFDIAIQRYGPIDGIEPLKKKLKEKIENENKLTNKDIMVTAGGNQAFINVILTLCDAGDEAILIAPYYFNHIMALQMCNIIPVIAKSNEDYTPDVHSIFSNITEKNSNGSYSESK